MANRTSLNRQRAARNLARTLSGDIDSQTARSVNPLTRDDALYRDEFLAAAELLADLEVLADDPDLQKIMDEPDVLKTDGRSGLWKLLSIAASVVVTVAVVFSLNWPVDNAEGVDTSRYVTRVGEQKTVNLKDGSTITLNTATQLVVSETQSERRVIFERGEAFFEVHPDQNRPFIVDAGYRTITVLGTSFNVHKNPDLLNIAVSEGEIAVHSSEESASGVAPMLSEMNGGGQASRDQFRMSAGWVMDLAVNDGQLTGYFVEDSASLAKWRSGLVEFAGEPLHKVVKELNRYSWKKILIEDPQIIDRKIFAVFKVGRMDQALKGLENTLQVKVTHYHDRIVLTGQ